MRNRADSEQWPTQAVTETRLPEVTVSDTQLRSECAHWIAALHPPNPRDQHAHWDITDCIARVAVLRGRPILRITGHLPAWTCGLLVSTNTQHDVIIRPPGHGVRTQHAELHQLGHLLTDRTTSPPAASHQATLSSLKLLRRLLPDLPDSMLLPLIGQPTSINPNERRAEMIASMLGGLLAQFQGRSWHRPSASRSPTHTRLTSMFPATTIGTTGR